MTAPRAMTAAVIGLPTKESGRSSFLAASVRSVRSGKTCRGRPWAWADGGLFSPGTFPEVPPARGAIRWGRYLSSRPGTSQ
jgi:hypothetical protein